MAEKKPKTLAQKNAERQAQFNAKQKQREARLIEKRKNRKADRKEKRKQFIELYHAKPKSFAYAEDPEGRPAGGISSGLGFHVCWQNGARGRDTDENPEGREVPNGASVGDIIEVAIDRLEYLNSKLPSQKNEDAIEKLKGAQKDLEDRKSERESRGVLGLDKE